MPILPELRNRPITEAEYWETIDDLLSSATAIGAYCLAFGELLRRDLCMTPPVRVLEDLVACTSVKQATNIMRREKHLLGRTATEWGLD